jgi:aldose 1-epimerase
MITRPVIPSSSLNKSPIERRDMARLVPKLGITLMLGALATLLLVASAGAQQQDNYAKGRKPIMKASVETTVFGKLDDGTEIQMYTLTNSRGASAKIITYGATLTELWVPDKNGQFGDVVLGFDDLKGYLGPHPHFGGVIGRVANRIAKGKFTLDGTQYTLAINNGPNTLHGGNVGFDRHVWKGEPVKSGNAAGVRLTYVSPDGEEGFPGKLTATVEYTLMEDNSLKIAYTATTDKPTIVNLTNHTYFNLSGAGDVLKDTVEINADSYTPVDSTMIPTGEIEPVKGTPLDFTKPMAIGARSTPLDPKAGAYDFNYVVNGKPGELRFAARVTDPSSGRVMEVRTTEPGIQLYTAIGLDGSIVGKRGVAYPKFGAVCLETEHFPDSINHPNFPSIILRPGSKFQSETTYKFSTEKGDK